MLQDEANAETLKEILAYFRAMKEESKDDQAQPA
jgi:hypothetical protein